jgi:hypothetical protein
MLPTRNRQSGGGRVAWPRPNSVKKGVGWLHLRPCSGKGGAGGLRTFGKKVPVHIKIVEY